MARTRQRYFYDKTDREAVLAAATRIPWSFDLESGADPKFRGDRDVVMAAVIANGLNLRHASAELRRDPEIVCAAVASKGSAIQYCSDRFKSDRVVVEIAVRSCGRALQWCDRKFRSDPELVRTAVEQCDYELQEVSDDYRNDKDLVSTALKVGVAPVFILDGVSESLKGDRELIMTGIERWGADSFAYASEELRNDREYVMAVVQKTGEALRFASEELQADREVVSKAVAQFGPALEYAAQRWRGDREIAAAALRAPNDGCACVHSGSAHGCPHAAALGAVSKELQGDRNFVLEAVSTSGLNMQYASPELRADREIVRKALQSGTKHWTPFILKHASEELRGDREIARDSISKNSRSFYFVSEELQMDPDIVALAWETVETDEDFLLWRDFAGSDFRKRCIAKLTALQIELKARKKLQQIDPDDPHSIVVFAEGWLAASTEKKWLVGETLRTMGISSSLYNTVWAYTGIDEDLMVASGFMRMGSILCHTKKGMTDNHQEDTWSAFVEDVQESFER